MGYSDVAGTPSPALTKSLDSLDASIGRIVPELKAKRLYDSTWIFVTSPYGQSPMDDQQLRFDSPSRLREAANAVQPDIVAHINGGDAAIIWLTNPAMTAAVVKAFGGRSVPLGIREIYSGARLTLTLNSPETDSRMPDIILQPHLVLSGDRTTNMSWRAMAGIRRGHARSAARLRRTTHRKTRSNLRPNNTTGAAPAASVGYGKVRSACAAQGTFSGVARHFLIAASTSVAPACHGSANLTERKRL